MKTILILTCVMMTGCIGNTLGTLQTGPAASATVKQEVQQAIRVNALNTEQLSRTEPTSAPIQRERLSNGRCNPYVPFDDFIKCDLLQAEKDVALERARN